MTTSSLKDFAQARSKRTRTCAICCLPADVLAEVNGAIADGIGPRLIGQWLQDEKGLPVTERNVSHHKGSRHHLEDM